jgi:alpha-beta hydrolase superfamily lysophospholipase
MGVSSWKRVFVSSFAIYIIMNIFIHFISDSMMFPYNQSSYNLNTPGLNFLTTEDSKKIDTRLWKAKDEKNLVLYFHGNYLDLGHLDEVAEDLNKQGYSVLAMDYRGYGLSDGRASEKNTYFDSELLYEYAQKLGYSAERIIIFGRSIGTGVATNLAANYKSKALILISPFVSAYRIMTNIPILPFDKFNNLAKLSKMNLPLFIVHGADDLVIKAWHSEMIFTQYEGLKYRLLIDGVGHNDILSSGLSGIIQQYESFIEGVK